MKAKYILLFLSWLLSISAKAEIDSLLLKKIEKELNSLIDRQVAQNLENDRLGKSHLNNYIINYQRVLDDESNYFKIQEANDGKTLWALDGVFFNESPDGIKGILNNLNSMPNRQQPYQKVYLVLISIYDYKRDILNWYQNKDKPIKDYKPVDNLSGDWTKASDELQKNNYKGITGTISPYNPTNAEAEKIKKQNLDGAFVSAFIRKKLGDNISKSSIACFSHYTRNKDNSYKCSTNIYRFESMPDAFTAVISQNIAGIDGERRNAALRDIVKSCSDFLKLNDPSGLGGDATRIAAWVRPAKENNKPNHNVLELNSVQESNHCNYIVNKINTSESNFILPDEGINTKLAMLYNRTRKSVYVATAHLDYLITNQDAQLLVDKVFEESSLEGDDILLLYLKTYNMALNKGGIVKVSSSGKYVKKPEDVQTAFKQEKNISKDDKEADKLGKSIMNVYFQVLYQEEVTSTIETMDYLYWRDVKVGQLAELPAINEAIFQNTVWYKERLCEPHKITYLDANKLSFIYKSSESGENTVSTYKTYYEDRYIGNVEIRVGENELVFYASTQRLKVKYPKIQKVNGKWIDEQLNFRVGYDGLDNPQRQNDLMYELEFETLKEKYKNNLQDFQIIEKESAWRIALMDYFKNARFINGQGTQHLFLAKITMSSDQASSAAIDFGNNRGTPSLRKVATKYTLGNVATMITNSLPISKPESITPRNNEDCKFELCQGFGKELFKSTCEELNKLVTKTGNRDAVQKLCNSIPNETRLKEIAEKLNSFSDNMAKSFLDDVKQYPCNDYNLCKHLSKLTVNQVEGWRIIQEGMESPNLNSTLAKNYDAVLDATACYIYMPDKRSELVSAIKTRKSSVKEFLTELSGIAEADNDTESIVAKYGGDKNSAFIFFRDKGSCTGAVAAPTLSEANPNQRGVLSTLEQERKDAREAYRNNPTRANKRVIIDKSEQIGEAAADAYFLPLGYIKLVCTFGNGKQGQFDRVYAKKDTQGNIIKIIVVECKGGTSPLGCRGQNQQGSKEYLESIILYMINKKNTSGASQDFKNTADLLKDFYDDIDLNIPNKKLEYYMVRQPFEDDGTIDNTQISKFQL